MLKQGSRKTYQWALVITVFWIGLLLLNMLPPEETFFHLSDFTLNTFGKYMAYAILALGIDLLWGYTGILSLGQGVFFGLGAYCMGMHLMLSIGSEGVYQSDLPDFMVWNQVETLPFFWKPFYSFSFSMMAVIMVPAFFALIFGYLTFRTRIKGVYFAIITQALALTVWLLFNQNSLKLGGTNGLTDFKTIIGFNLSALSTQRILFGITGLCLVVAFIVCRWLTLSRFGKILVAIRDNEGRIRFSGYDPSRYKLFVFVIAAALAEIGGCFAFWAWLRLDKSIWWLVPGVISLVLFAFSTAIAWSYYGDRAIIYLVGFRGVMPYRIFYCFAFFMASFMDTTIVWNIAAVAIVLMTLPNLLGIMLMRKEMKSLVRDYWEEYGDKKD